MAKKIVKFLDMLSPSELKLTDLPRKPDSLMNCSFNEYGQIVKRSGYAKYNVTSIGSGHKITGLHRFYKQLTSSKEFLCSWNTSLYKLPDAGDHDGVALTNCPTLTADADTYFADFANHCYIVNGEDTMMKYNMTNVRTDGIAVPSAAPTGTSPAGGSLSAGDYLVKYTYVDEDGYESNASPASAAIAASASDKITLAIVVSSDAKVTKRRIYRTIADGAIFYYDKEVANNTAITVDLTQADSTLSLKTVLHTDHNAPPSAPDLVAKRRSRINIAVDDDLYVSKNYDKTTGVMSVEYFPSTLYFPTGNGQKITGLLEQLTGLPVFTDDSIERFTGTDEKNFEFKNSYATEGNIAVRSLVNCDNLLVYLEFDGIHYFDGVSTGIFSKALNEYIKANIVDAYAHLSCGAYFDDKYILCYTKSGTVPNEAIYIDLKNNTYGIYNYSFSCFSKWSRGTDGLRLFGGSNTEGRVYEIDSGLDDDGSEIEAYDKIEPLNFGNPARYKQIYHIYIKIKTTTGTALRFYYTLDNNSETYKDKTLTASTTRWYKIDLSGGGQRCREIAIRPRMNDKYYFEIHGYAVVFEEEAPEWS